MANVAHMIIFIRKAIDMKHCTYGPLLLTWSVYCTLCVGLNPTIHQANDSLSMLGLKLTHVDNMAPVRLLNRVYVLAKGIDVWTK